MISTPFISILTFTGASCSMLLVIASCGGTGSDSDSSVTVDSGIEDSATGSSEFIPESLYLAVGEAEWDGSTLTSFFRDPNDPSSTVEPYIDLRLLELGFLQQVTPERSCSWISAFDVEDRVALIDPLQSSDTESNWAWIHLPLQLELVETDCEYSGFSEFVESVESLELTLSMGPIQLFVEVEVVQMLQTLGYDYADVAGRMFGTRLGWVTSTGEEVWSEIGWGVSRRLDQGALFTDGMGNVELQQLVEEIPPGALSIYGVFDIELEQLFR